MLDFGRAICADLAAAERREWLVTNGIGGFASGTIAGTLTRCYHGLLIAALKPPLGRTLMLTRFDEYAGYGGHTYPLFANRWAAPPHYAPADGGAPPPRQSGVVEPHGFQYLERFQLEGTTPLWSYAFGDSLLSKRIWMEPGANVTYIRYTLERAAAPLSLAIKALANYRDYHGSTRAGDFNMEVEPVEYGLCCRTGPAATPLYLLSERAEASAQQIWYNDFYLSIEAERGLVTTEDHLYVGLFSTILLPGESVTMIAATTDRLSLDGAAAYAARRDYEAALLRRVTWSAEEPVQRLALAADQFIVLRNDRPASGQEQARSPAAPMGRTVIAGYHWFSDWGRDTMIALPGLTLPTGRSEVAASVIRTFSRYVDQGMLPNRFPDEREEPEYNTADATLWYFEAIRAYHAATGDDQLLRELFPVLQEIIDWHLRGTRYGIGVDPADGLLRAGEEGTQLTWMDVRINGWTVTPRVGKPVEINALWYNALCAMTAFAERLGLDGMSYATMAGRVRAGFVRFWHSERRHCYDVIDGPHGADATVRPNQLFAVSLPASPLTLEQQRAVVEVCTRRLLCSYGLRSLDPGHPDYGGCYLGDRLARDSVYHQGTVWGWLIGPFVSAHLRVYGDKAAARAFLLPLIQHLEDAGLGSISEIFDGDPPHSPRGCIAQAWSVAELLRVWQEADQYQA